MSDLNHSPDGLATTRLLDPDGNVVEFSCSRRVFATVRERWGHLLPAGAR